MVPRHFGSLIANPKPRSSRDCLGFGERAANFLVLSDQSAIISGSSVIQSGTLAIVIPSSIFAPPLRRTDELSA
jgi:hypothetical protein